MAEYLHIVENDPESAQAYPYTVHPGMLLAVQESARDCLVQLSQEDYDEAEYPVEALQSEQFSDTYREMDIAGTRDFLRQLQPWQREILNPRIAPIAARVVGSLVPKAKQSTDWIGVLAEADAGSLVTFFDTNARQVADINQGDQFQRRISRFRSAFIEQVATAVETGELPEKALTDAQRAKDVPIVATDVFDIEAQNVQAYYMPGWHTIAVGPKTPYIVVAHELGHALFKPFEYEPFDEGLVEHLNQGLQSGNFTTLSPDKRRHDSGIYEQKRLMIDAFTNSGAEYIPPQLLVDAQVCGTSTGVAHENLLRKTESAYPDKDIWKSIDQWRETAQATIGNKFPEAHEIQMEEGMDLYATAGILATGAVKRHMPASRIGRILDRRAKKNEGKAYDAENHPKRFAAEEVIRLGVMAQASRQAAKDFEDDLFA